MYDPSMHANHTPTGSHELAGIHSGHYSSVLCGPPLIHAIPFAGESIHGGPLSAILPHASSPAPLAVPHHTPFGSMTMTPEGTHWVPSLQAYVGDASGKVVAR